MNRVEESVCYFFGIALKSINWFPASRHIDYPKHFFLLLLWHIKKVLKSIVKQAWTFFNWFGKLFKMGKISGVKKFFCARNAQGQN